MASMIVQMHTHTHAHCSRTHTHIPLGSLSTLRLCTWLLVCPVQVRRAVYPPRLADCFSGCLIPNAFGCQAAPILPWTRRRPICRQTQSDGVPSSSPAVRHGFLGLAGPAQPSLPQGFGGALWGPRAQLSAALLSGNPVGLCVASGPSSAQLSPALLSGNPVGLFVAFGPSSAQPCGWGLRAQLSPAQPCSAAIRWGFVWPPGPAHPGLEGGAL